METWLYTISGSVQGVGFRRSVLKYVEAKKLKLRGYVQNLPDGGVLIRATGDLIFLELLKEYVQQGPPGAKVTKALVEKQALIEGGEHSEPFHIRY